MNFLNVVWMSLAGWINTLASSRFWGISRQNNRIARGIACA